jgi:hypothetical protein
MNSHYLLTPNQAKLMDWLFFVITTIQKEKQKKPTLELNDSMFSYFPPTSLLDKWIRVNHVFTAYLRKVLNSTASSVEKALNYLLATGNVALKSNSIDIPQMSGFSIVAERLNYLRYVS